MILLTCLHYKFIISQRFVLWTQAKHTSLYLQVRRVYSVTKTAFTMLFFILCKDCPNLAYTEICFDVGSFMVVLGLVNWQNETRYVHQNIAFFTLLMYKLTLILPHKLDFRTCLNYVYLICPTFSKSHFVST